MSSGYMESQMQQQIEAGISEAERCYARIAELEIQRDQLLAALVELRAAIRAGKYEDPNHDRIYQALIDSEVAIAAAKAGE